VEGRTEAEEQFGAHACAKRIDLPQGLGSTNGPSANCSRRACMHICMQCATMTLLTTTRAVFQRRAALCPQRCSDDLLRDLPSTAVACAYSDSVSREPLCRQQLRKVPSSYQAKAVGTYRETKPVYLNYESPLCIRARTKARRSHDAFRLICSYHRWLGRRIGGNLKTWPCFMLRPSAANNDYLRHLSLSTLSL
jgi:hypothetical protein